MKKILLLLLVSAFIVSVSYAQDTPPSADEIMAKAIKQAKKEKKDIFLMFHASWCGWCKRMDAAMKDDSCKDYFDNNFITIHMVVKESAANKNLENPGAAEFLAKYKGDKSGIPFWLIFDKKGEMIADCFMGEEGSTSIIGCPASEEEVKLFIERLKVAGPVTADEEKAITARFRKNAN